MKHTSLSKLQIHLAVHFQEIYYLFIIVAEGATNLLGFNFEATKWAYLGKHSLKPKMSSNIEGSQFCSPLNYNDVLWKPKAISICTLLMIDSGSSTFIKSFFFFQCLSNPTIRLHMNYIGFFSQDCTYTSKQIHNIT